jgi:hydroxymethylpyrimidine pyrophosphatase-like HAD family hydrolase
MSNSPDTNDTDTDSPFDLIAEGYSKEEAKRMAGEYDADDDEYCFGDGDRDIPDFVDEEDFG